MASESTVGRHSSQVLHYYMSRADRLKEEIGWLKVAFGIAVALDASLVAWLAQNYATASPIIVGAGLIAVLVVAGMIVLINRRAYKRIEELENV